jgi:hypothetical protein
MIHIGYPLGPRQEYGYLSRQSRIMVYILTPKFYWLMSFKNGLNKCNSSTTTLCFLCGLAIDIQNPALYIKIPFSVCKLLKDTNHSISDWFTVQRTVVLEDHNVNRKKSLWLIFIRSRNSNFYHDPSLESFPHHIIYLNPIGKHHHLGIIQKGLSFRLIHFVMN